MKSEPDKAEHFQSIGQPMRRKEDLRLITGQGRFSDDFELEGQVFAGFVRSPHPHARIVAIDTEAARAMPGVLGVLTGEDCRRDGLRPIEHGPVPSTRYDMKLTAAGGGRIFAGRHTLLPTDKVRHVGEAVAMVVAQTVHQAQDAAEVIHVTYDARAPVTGSEAALAPDAPVIWPDLPPQSVLFRSWPLTWTQWVETWRKDQDGLGHPGLPGLDLGLGAEPPAPPPEPPKAAVPGL